MEITHNNPPASLPDVVAQIEEAGAFIDEDGDLNIISCSRVVVCFLGSTLFVHSARWPELKELAPDKRWRPVRPGESFTITF